VLSVHTDVNTVQKRLPMNIDITYDIHICIFRYDHVNGHQLLKIKMCLVRTVWTIQRVSKRALQL
jgi:hypothetical protein